MNVFELVAKISLDTGEYESGLEEASGKTSSFSDKLKSDLGTAAKVGAAAIGAVTTASAALATATATGVKNLAAYGDNIDKMSQKMGLSAEAYQEWDAIMQHSGTSIESLQAGMKTLANAVESGNGAFERLGITQEQISSMNNEELFSATITALQNVENETERTYLAGQLLGRGATELGALLNTSAEDTEAMRQRVHELGGVMSDESVKAAAAFQDSLQDLKTGISGISRGILSDFLPSVTAVMDGLTMLVTEENGAAELLSSGVDSFLNNLLDMIPKISDVGGKLIESLASSIINNLPQIIEVGSTVVFNLVNGISSNLPTLGPLAVDAVLQFVMMLTDPDTLGNLISAALNIILALSDGIIRAIPELIKAVPIIIKNLIEAFLENLPKIAETGIELILSLGTGIDATIPELLSYVIKIPAAILDGIKDGLVGIVEIGPDLVKKLWESIKSMGGWLSDKVTGFFSGIVDSVKNLFGIKSTGTGERTISVGSYATGLNRVPYDNFPAYLHKDEAVLTAKQANDWRRGSQSEATYNTYNYNMVLDTKNVRELNDIISIAKNQRITTRMGVA